jgi:hypothetical protein
VVLGTVLLLATAGPAAADPAKPTDYRSEITSIEPALSGASVKIIGGDSFLQVRADRGHEVIVYAFSATDAGGRGEPFLRITATGAVEENLQSPYTYSIRTRYGEQPPDGLDPTGDPQWSHVGSGGSFAWHDHRIHWMSPDRKAGIEPGDVVQDWTVPLSVDGTDVTVTGVLRLAHPVSAVPWLALAALLAVAVVVVGKGSSTFVAGLVAVPAAALALAAGLGEHAAVPAAAGGSALVAILPGIALVAAVAGLLVHRKPLGVIASLLAVALLAGWAILRFSVLTKPVLPTELSYGLDRLATAAALGVGLGVAVLAVRSGKLIPALPELVDDPPASAPPGGAPTVCSAVAARVVRGVRVEVRVDVDVLVVVQLRLRTPVGDGEQQREQPHRERDEQDLVPATLMGQHDGFHVLRFPGATRWRQLRPGSRRPPRRRWPELLAGDGRWRTSPRGRVRPTRPRRRPRSPDRPTPPGAG